MVPNEAARKVETYNKCSALNYAEKREMKI